MVSTRWERTRYSEHVFYIFTFSGIQPRCNRILNSFNKIVSFILSSVPLITIASNALSLALNVATRWPGQWEVRISRNIQRATSISSHAWKLLLCMSSDAINLSFSVQWYWYVELTIYGKQRNYYRLKSGRVSCFMYLTVIRNKIITHSLLW